MLLIISCISLVRLFLIQEFVNEQSTVQQCLMNQQDPLGEIDTIIKPSQENNVITC